MLERIFTPNIHKYPFTRKVGGKIAWLERREGPDEGLSPDGFRSSLLLRSQHPLPR